MCDALYGIIILVGVTRRIGSVLLTLPSLWKEKGHNIIVFLLTSGWAGTKEKKGQNLSDYFDD